MRALRAGAVHFAIAFAAGWLLGPVRELVMIPQFGRTEIAGARWVRGLTVSEYLASFSSAPGAISLALFSLFAAMPALVPRQSAAR